MQPGSATSSDIAAMQLCLRGKVQGLGVRPAIFRLAKSLHLSGTVQNSPEGVQVRVEGEPSAIAEFVARLADALPPHAVCEEVIQTESRPFGQIDFAIRSSDANPSGEVGAAPLPQDLAVCGDCLREVFDSANRRFRYPFTSCTRCGPRYSIIEAMPYERCRTSMEEFPFCRQCAAEYRSPGSRRFHAQTNACAECGPQLWATAGGVRHSTGEAALRFAVELLRAGRVLALKGIGGYQLFVDAVNGEAVQRLRQRKQRREKPFAVLVRSPEEARKLAFVGPTELAALTAQANPIVLLRARRGTILCDGIHPGLRDIGLMLPTTPLHALLAADFERPLVCTSGNDEGEPLVFDEVDAEAVLADVCDGFLHHNRRIIRPIDDSVVRVIAGRTVTLRLARGLAPLSLNLPAGEPLLALGGQWKTAAAWCNGRQAVLGPHVGEIDSLGARERLLNQIDGWRSVYSFRPRRLTHDLHPDSFTHDWARGQSKPAIAVQHHRAHVAAGMLEHGWLDREVLGVAWDGTGYGPDGTIWGGEFLAATVQGFQRVARIRPFALPGGEACVREPWRTALAVLSDSTGPDLAGQFFAQLPQRKAAQQLLAMLRADKIFPRTSSAGRLFDAAAFLIAGIGVASYEAEAAMKLEAAADVSAAGEYRFPATAAENGAIPAVELDWRPLFEDLLEDRRGGASPGEMSMRFHRSLASGIARVCRMHLQLPVVLCGGVFQNRLLTELVVESLDGGLQPVGLPGIIPPGDGGLAAGQLAIAIAGRERG